MKQRLLLSTLAAAACLSFAGAAAAQDWTGSYISLHLGGATADDDESERTLFDTNLDGTFGDTVRVGNATTGPDAFSSSATQAAGFCGGKAFGNNFGAGCDADDQVEFDYGIRAGYDMQMGGFVVGGLVEASTNDVRDHATGFSTTPANYTFGRGLEGALFAARARIGLPAGNGLYYATGGVAFAEVEEEYTTSNVANAFSPVTGKSDAIGFQIGGGAEFWINDRVTIGAEYIYTGLEVDDPLVTRISRGTGPATNPFVLTNANGTNNRREADEFNFHSIRLTISSRF